MKLKENPIWFLTIALLILGYRYDINLFYNIAAGINLGYGVAGVVDTFR